MGKTKPIFTRNRKKFSFFRLFVILLISLFLGGIGYIVVRAYDESQRSYRDREGLIKPVIDSWESLTDPGKKAFENKNDLIILCVGLDENRDEKGIAHHKGSRTDTIFLLHLDRDANRLGVLSIPRDTWIPLSDKYYNGKINSAYSLAFWDEYEESDHNYEKAKLAGINQVKKTVESFLKVKVDYYILIKIKAARELVDAIGGLTLDVEKDMDYDDNWGNLHIHLKKGQQRLDGEQSIGYARYRHDEEGDWGRIRRQQQVIRALVKEFKKPSNIVSPQKVKNLAEVMKRNLDTDMPQEVMIDLALVYKNLNRNNIIRGIISGTDGNVGGAAVIYPNELETERLTARILKNPNRLKPKDLRLQVYNGCGLMGIAQNASEKLKKDNYDIINVGNTEKEDVDISYIIDHYKNTKGFEGIEGILGDKNIKRVVKSSDDRELNPDFTIILGKDYGEEVEKKDPPDDVPTLPPLEPEETTTPEVTPAEIRL